MTTRQHPRRPAPLDPKDAELITGDVDPALSSEVAHRTADAVVHGGHDEDPELAARIAELVAAEGLDEIAALWFRSPANTLPGALWRIYLVREWIRRAPETIGARFEEGAGSGLTPATAVPPDALRAELDALLAGRRPDQLADVLRQAAAFLRVLAAGVTHEDRWLTHDDDRAEAVTGRSSALEVTATELEDAATLAAGGTLA